MLNFFSKEEQRNGAIAEGKMRQREAALFLERQYRAFD